MGGTKIVVLHLREIIKTLIFALIGIALIVVLIYLFIPKDKPGEPDAAAYVPGTYISQITLNKEPVNVEVVVSESEILSIELKNMAEVQEVFYPLVQPTMKQLAEEIIDTQSLDVNISSENSVTSNVLLNAVRSALNQAQASATY